MIFRIYYSEEFLSTIKALDNATAKRVMDKLEATSENPTRFFERLVGREEYKMRIGDYRVIAKIAHNDNSIFIISLGHRKNIYKRLR